MAPQRAAGFAVFMAGLLVATPAFSQSTYTLTRTPVVCVPTSGSATDAGTFLGNCSSTAFAGSGTTIVVATAAQSRQLYQVSGNSVILNCGAFTLDGTKLLVASATFLPTLFTSFSIRSSTVPANGGTITFAVAIGTSTAAANISAASVMAALAASPGVAPTLNATGPAIVFQITFPPGGANPINTVVETGGSAYNLSTTATSTGNTYTYGALLQDPTATTFPVANSAAGTAAPTNLVYNTWAISSNMNGAAITVAVAGGGTSFATTLSPPSPPPAPPRPPPAASLPLAAAASPPTFPPPSPGAAAQSTAERALLAAWVLAGALLTLQSF